jgi:heptosyltransferase-2
MPPPTVDRGARHLIVKLAALGDVVMASALVGAIRARDANAHVTWLCGRGVASLVARFDGVDEALAVDEGALLTGGLVSRASALSSLWRTLARRRFDMTLIAHADPRYRAALGLARLGEVRRLEARRPGHVLPIPGRYFGDEYARLLDGRPSHGPIPGHAPLARVRGLGTSGPRDGVVLVPGGARNVLRESALRRWPVERYREVAGALLGAGHRVTLVGDANDRWVRPWFQGLRIDDALGTRDIGGTLELLATAALVITHDTGPLHLAMLAKAPTLALFGPTMPTQFVYPLGLVEAFWGGADLACRPCYDGREFAACANNLCIQGVPVATVVARAIAALDGSRPVTTPSVIFPA